MAKYDKQVAEDKAADTVHWAPGVKGKTKNHPTHEANILKGCAKGGFYDQLDEALREVNYKAECKAYQIAVDCSASAGGMLDKPISPAEIVSRRANKPGKKKLSLTMVRLGKFTAY